MDIPYKVIEGTPVGEDQTRVVVETQLAVVVNGYGGGRLTFVVQNALMQEQIEEKILWKFGEQAPAYGSQHRLIGDLSKVQSILDAEEVARETERARVEVDRLAAIQEAVVESSVESPAAGEASPVERKRF